MGYVTFDPERLHLLRRALVDLERRLHLCRTLMYSDDVAALIRRAHALVGNQISRVESSLREISMAGRPRSSGFLSPSFPCRSWPTKRQPDIHDPVAQFEEWARDVPHWWTQATTRSATRSDEILRRLDVARHPERAGRFIDALSRPELVVLGTSDLSLVEELWRAATDPSTTSSAVAGQRIRRLLDVVFDDRPWEKGVASGRIDPVARSRREICLHDLTARIVAPWQIDVIRDPDWRWSQAQGAHRLHQISTLESSANTLLDGLSGALQRSLTTLPDDRSLRLEYIDSVSRAVGTALEVHRMSDVDRARSDSGLDTVRNLLGALAIDGPWPMSILIDAGARWIGDHFDTSDARIDAAVLESLGQREILATVAVTAVLAASLRRRERLPSRIGESPTTIDPQLAADLRHTYQSIDNAAGRGQTLAQLTGSP